MHLSGGPYSKDCSILGFILGSPCFRKRPYLLCTPSTKKRRKKIGEPADYPPCQHPTDIELPPNVGVSCNLRNRDAKLML